MEQIHKPVEVCPELVSNMALNSYIRGVSAVRNQMTHGFRSQSLVTTGATPKASYSGMEDEMGKTTFSVRFDCDAEILTVINMDVETRDGGRRNPRTVIIYRNKETDTYDYLDVPMYHCIHQYYGFMYKRNPSTYYKAIQPGAHIPAGTIIADSPSILEDGTNAYGIETKYANMTLPETTEDGALVSYEWCNENKVFCVERRQIRFGGEEFLLNIHGDLENYYGIPRLGHTIPDSGLVFASRRINRSLREDLLSPVLLHPAFLRTPEYGDTTVYGRAGATVTDVKILRGKNEKAEYPPLFDKQVHDLHRRGFDFYKRINDVENELLRRYGKTHGYLKTSPKLKRLFIDALAEISGSGFNGKPKHNIIYEKLPVNHWLAIVEYCYWITPSIGNKISDEQGCKHIIVAQKPRADMPTDDDGEVSDVVADPQAVISRNNVPRFITQYINAASRKLGKRINAMVQEGKAAEAWKLLYDYYVTITDEVIPLMQDERFKPEDELKEVMRLGTARPYVPLDNSKYLSYFELIQILREKFRPCYGPVTYRGNSGRIVRTKRPVLIGSIYTIILEKDGRDGTAVGSSRLHATFATPSKPSSAAGKVSLPGKESPVKIWAEAENRNLGAVTNGKGPRIVSEYNTNVLAHRAVMEAIYATDKPTAIIEAVDWNVVKMTGGRMVRFIRNMLQASGVEIVESEH